MVNTPLAAQEEEYARGFRETPGIVGPEGVYLAGATFWYPQFRADLVSFSIEARLPEGWHAISQGTGTSRDQDGVARWQSPDPMDEIYLVGGPLRQWREQAVAMGARLVILATHSLEYLALGFDDSVARRRNVSSERQIRRLERLAAGLGVPVIDQAAYIRAQGKDLKQASFRFDGPWNEYGHQTAAEAIAHYLIEHAELCGARP